MVMNDGEYASAKYRGPVSIANRSTPSGSAHHRDHWWVDECGPLGCLPRDVEGPGGDAPLALGAVVVGPASCEDHRAHVVGCLDCAAAVCAAEDDDLGNFLARMESIGWPEESTRG